MLQVMISKCEICGEKPSVKLDGATLRIECHGYESNTQVSGEMDLNLNDMAEYVKTVWSWFVDDSQLRLVK